MDMIGGMIAVVIVFWIIAKVFKGYADSKGGIKIQYLGGHPLLKGPKQVRLDRSNNYLTFNQIYIPIENITDIKLVPRSAVGGALAGAALGAVVAGPVGALVGGAAAAGNPGANNVIQLSYSEDDINYEIFFADADIINKYPLVQRMIKG